MSIFRFSNIKISAIACAVPKNVVRTESFSNLFGEEEVNKFMTMTGITETRRTSKHQTASDLGYRAAEEILSAKNIDRKEIGALIFGTHSPDYRRPASAFTLHKRLGLSLETVVFDISLGCTSMVHGIQVLASLMNSSDIKKGLLIVGDTAAKTVYPKDRASIMIVGDGSAAILLEKTDTADPIVTLLRSDGNGYRYLIVPGGGYRNLDASREVTVCPDGNERTLHNSFMMGTSVFTFTISDVPRAIRDFWEITKTNVDSYDCFAFHQANLYILKQIAKKLKIAEEKMPLTLYKYGNTSGASPAITLCETFGSSAGKDMNILLCAFGIGLSWGVSSMRINSSDILPVVEDDSVFEEGIINSPAEL
jgi:3-oxoacyl-[acyl-carrier-protein] synthase III